LVISGLVVGGAERVLTALANGWTEAGRHVAMVTLDSPETAPFFPLDPRVDVHRLGLAAVSRNGLEAIANNARRLVVLRRAILQTQPDVVVSFMDRTNVLTLLATVGRRLPIIVADRSAAEPGSRIWRSLRRLAYRRARWIVVQTQGSAQRLPADLRARAVVIPNPVLEAPPVSPAQGSPRDTPGPSAPDPHLVVALGRLVPQKGFDLLIDAFASVVRRVPAVRLEIWGAGPEAGRLRRLVSRTGLDTAVTLPGATTDPAAVLAGAGIFVLSSRVEGFPNVLLEAMALGRPVIAVDCTFGPGEILRDGINGRLVPAGDTGALADAIVQLVETPELAAALGARAIEVRQRFAFDSILRSWSELADDAKAGPDA
jgi:glycosyltransferase involved in cell wall biosynthesis